jgi:hypothetical protein
LAPLLWRLKFIFDEYGKLFSGKLKNECCEGATWMGERFRCFESFDMSLKNFDSAFEDF